MNGVHQASIGAIPDVEADLRSIAREGEGLRLRILDAGGKRDPPVVVAHLDGNRVVCRMRGGTLWTFSHLLGSALPKNALVTVEAWRDVNKVNAPAADQGGRERLEAVFIHFLGTAHLNEAFRLCEVAKLIPGKLPYRALEQIARACVGRGILEMRVQRGCRVFILRRRPVHLPALDSCSAMA